jgi:hypothetical protein
MACQFVTFFFQKARKQLHFLCFYRHKNKAILHDILIQKHESFFVEGGFFMKKYVFLFFSVCVLSSVSSEVVRLSKIASWHELKDFQGALGISQPIKYYHMVTDSLPPADKVITFTAQDLSNIKKNQESIAPKVPWKDYVSPQSKAFCPLIQGNQRVSVLLKMPDSRDDIHLEVLPKTYAKKAVLKNKIIRIRSLAERFNKDLVCFLNVTFSETNFSYKKMVKSIGVVGIVVSWLVYQSSSQEAFDNFVHPVRSAARRGIVNVLERIDHSERSMKFRIFSKKVHVKKLSKALLKKIKIKRFRFDNRDQCSKSDNKWELLIEEIVEKFLFSEEEVEARVDEERRAIEEDEIAQKRERIRKEQEAAERKLKEAKEEQEREWREQLKRSNERLERERAQAESDKARRERVPSRRHHSQEANPLFVFVGGKYSLTRARCFSVKTLYDILCLRQDCDSSQIRKAYLNLALKFHPDKFDKNFPDEVEKKALYAECFKAITAANNILSDDEQKSNYDLSRDVSSDLDKMTRECMAPIIALLPEDLPVQQTQPVRPSASGGCTIS